MQGSGNLHVPRDPALEQGVQGVHVVDLKAISAATIGRDIAVGSNLEPLVRCLVTLVMNSIVADSLLEHISTITPNNTSTIQADQLTKISRPVLQMPRSNLKADHLSHLRAVLKVFHSIPQCPERGIVLEPLDKLAVIDRLQRVYMGSRMLCERGHKRSRAGMPHEDHEKVLGDAAVTRAFGHVGEETGTHIRLGGVRDRRDRGELNGWWWEGRVGAEHVRGEEKKDGDEGEEEKSGVQGETERRGIGDSGEEHVEQGRAGG